MRVSRELSEEDEFGMNKPGSFESDPMEVEKQSAVKDHPDFEFVREPELRELMERRDDDTLGATWLKDLPVEKDVTQWTFLRVQIRPDRAWMIIQELVATICIGHGMVLAEETPSSVLFRKKVGQDTMAHGMMDAATYQNLFVAIGVLPSKLRAIHIGYHVSNEQKLLGGVKTSHFSSVSSDRMKALNRSMDNLLAALQSTLTSQYLTSSYLYMTTPENTAEPGHDGDAIELDKGYVNDVRRTFLKEMKANLRELCIPLEEYAHQQEYAGALLLGLLDPLLKKYDLDVSSSANETKSKADGSTTTGGKNEPPSQAQTTATETVEKSESEPERDQALSNGKLYGEIITDMVHELWAKYKLECELKVKQKIEEKQKQVTARVQAVQKLRARALESIIHYPGAAIAHLKDAVPGTRDDVLLYDGNCVVNNVPVRLQISYGAIIYRTMVPLFARTTIVPFADIGFVSQSSTLGIRVVYVQLKDSHTKGLTIAMGVEVDLLFQLLLEIQDAHKRDRSRVDRRSSSSISMLPDMSQFDAPNLETLIGADEEEEKEGDEDEEEYANDEDQKAKLQELLDSE